MLTVEQALERIVAVVHETPSETIPLDRCLARVPAVDSVIAPIDVPPFANSSMDGFAVRAGDCPGELRVIGEVAAGAASLPEVRPGTAVRIMTGAPLPPGADAVVPIEDVTETEDRVTIGESVDLGAYVRAAGHDTPRGASVALPAAPLTPALLGVLNSIGLTELQVRRRPVVAILSTGDELVAPGSPLRPGQIYDANSPALAAAVAEAGGQPLVLPRAPDVPAEIERRVREGVEAADLLVASGGVSVGRHDHVRETIERLGDLDFWRIAVQPGKPLAFGEIDGVPVVGLPGNPVSALVTFELFLRPMLRAMLGLPGDGRQRVKAATDERIGKDRERRAYLRVRVQSGDGGYVARSAGGQQSSQLRSMADANALLVVPEGVPATQPGERYEAILLGNVA
ncbi:MAG TPA: gephyrin-like molybdotransferase Glp [Candidatus Limnocylindria bacterium]|nr:gephyrin-like molybdotransferase Glp [Candidatus Limnocylindria bacterium]